MSYISTVRAVVVAEVAKTGYDLNEWQIGAYTLLTLVKGEQTTLADVHDAWAVGTEQGRPDHRSLIPFDDLSSAVAALDQPFLDAVHAAARIVAADAPGQAEKVAVIGSLHQPELLEAAAAIERAEGRHVVGVPTWMGDVTEDEAVATYLPIIALADTVVVVLRPDGELGPWAAQELGYAVVHGKHVRMAAVVPAAAGVS